MPPLGDESGLWSVPASCMGLLEGFVQSRSLARARVPIRHAFKLHLICLHDFPYDTIVPENVPSSGAIGRRIHLM